MNPSQQPTLPTQPPIAPQPPVPQTPIQPAPAASPAPAAAQQPLPVQQPLPQPPQPTQVGGYPAQPPVGSTPGFNTTQPPKKSKMRLVVAGLIVLFVLAGVGGFIAVNKATSAPTSVAEAFVADIQSGNADAAYALTSTEFQKAASKDGFSSLVEHEDNALPDSKAKVVSKEIVKNTAGTTATVVLNIKDDKGSEDYNAKVMLVQQDSKWLVFNINIKAGLAS